MDAICGQFFLWHVTLICMGTVLDNSTHIIYMVLIKCMQRKIIALFHKFISFFLLIFILMSDDCSRYLVHIVCMNMMNRDQFHD